jgi:hypothetical protein
MAELSHLVSTVLYGRSLNAVKGAARERCPMCFLPSSPYRLIANARSAARKKKNPYGWVPSFDGSERDVEQ